MEKIGESDLKISFSQQPQPSTQFTDPTARHPTVYNIQGNQQAFFPASMVSGQPMRMRPAFDQSQMYHRPLDNLKNSTAQWSAPQIDSQQFNSMFYNKQARGVGGGGGTPFYPGLAEGIRPAFLDASAVIRPGQVLIARGQNNAFPLRLAFQQQQQQPIMHRDVARLAADNWNSHQEADAGSRPRSTDGQANGKVVGSGVCTSPVSDYEAENCLTQQQHNSTTGGVESPAARHPDSAFQGHLIDDSCSRDAPPPSVTSIASGQSDEMLMPDSSHQPLTLSARKSEKQVGMNAVYDKMVSIGDEPDRAAFLAQLFNFMKARTTPITAIPIICRQVVDLYKLYNVVKQFGGMMQVTKAKQWRDVSSLMSFGGSSSAGFTLKRNYCRFIFPYECKFDRNDMDPTPIIAAMETTSKKEGTGKKKDKDQNYDSMDNYTHNDGYFINPAENGNQNLSAQYSEMFNGDGPFLQKKIIGCDGKYTNGMVNTLDANQQISSTNNDFSKFAGFRGAGSQSYKHLASAIDSQISSSTTDASNSKQDVHTTLKRDLIFPSDSVEATKAQRFKRKKISPKDIASTDLWRIMLALRSGQLFECTWALDALSILTYDTSTSCYFNLNVMTGLLELLTEHLQYCLSLIFQEFEDQIQSDTNRGTKLEEYDDIEPVQPPAHHQLIQSLRRRCNATIEYVHVDDKKPQLFNLPGIQTPEFDFTSIQSHLIVSHSLCESNFKKSFYGPTYHLRPALTGESFTKERIKTDDNAVLNDSHMEFEDLVDKLSKEMGEEAKEPEGQLFHQIEEWQNSITRRCIAITNILRNLATVEGNDAVMGRHYALISIIAKLLLLHHEHVFQQLASRSPANNTDEDWNQHETVPLLVDCWWWDSLLHMRDRCFVILASISQRIDLTTISETSCTLICNGLIHWLICKSSQALDCVSSSSTVCLQRLALEALCRLAILPDNVELIVATQPFTHLACALDRLVENIPPSHVEAMREMSIDLLLRLARADGGSVSRLMGLGARGQRIFALLLNFLEDAEKQSKQQLESGGTADEGEGSEAIFRVSELLQRISISLENKMIIRRHNDTLLQLVMSEALKTRVVRLLAEIIAIPQ